MSYYYKKLAKTQLTENPDPVRVLYWASRWVTAGVWEVEAGLLAQCRRTYRAAYERDNPLALRASSVLAAKLLPKMKEVWA